MNLSAQLVELLPVCSHYEPGPDATANCLERFTRRRPESAVSHKSHVFQEGQQVVLMQLVGLLLDLEHPAGEPRTPPCLLLWQRP